MAKPWYGAEHQKLRRSWAVRVATGTVVCSRCGNRIQPGTPWDLDHQTGSKTLYRGPSHRKCNRRTGAIRIETDDPAPIPRTRW